VPTHQRARDGKNGLRQHAKKQACTNDHQKSNLKMASSDSDHVKVVKQIFFLARDHFASFDHESDGNWRSTYNNNTRFCLSIITIIQAPTYN
jgi:hypothetical protein